MAITKNPHLSPSAIRAADPLMPPEDAAEYIGVSPGTLSVWRSTGRYDLPFLKIGRSVRYRKADLDSWLERRTRAGHVDAGMGQGVA